VRRDGVAAVFQQNHDDAWSALRLALPNNPYTCLDDAITHLNEVRCGTIRLLEQELQELRAAAKPVSLPPALPPAPNAVEAAVDHHTVSPAMKERLRLAAVPSPAAIAEMRFQHSRGASVAEMAEAQWESGIGKLRRFRHGVIAAIVRAPEPTAPVADEPSTSDDKEAARP